MLARQYQVVVSTAATGAGKTLTFWLPLLVEKKKKKGTTFIIVPLKDLGQQMADDAALFGLSAFNATVTSGSDPHITRNTDMRRTSEAESDG